MSRADRWEVGSAFPLLLPYHDAGAQLPDPARLWVRSLQSSPSGADLPSLGGYRLTVEPC